MRSLLRRPVRTAVIAVTVAAATMTAGCNLSSNPSSAQGGKLAKNASLKGAKFTVGSKEFTEQLILCHITSLALQSAGATVAQRCGLQGSNTTRTALTSGDVDIYWEYTGTAWINYLKNNKPITDPDRQYESAARQDLSRNHIKWLKRAPANNTYAVAVKSSTAKALGVSTLADYARLVHSKPSKASMCVASEFASRSDGLPGLEKAYGFKVPKANLASLAEGAIYNGISKGKPCNFGEVATTDGRIKALHLKALTDDKHFFPIYNPAPTVRESVYKKHPDLAKILKPIANALTSSVLQQLNGEVDIKGKDEAEVAKTWLQSKHFIGK